MSRPPLEPVSSEIESLLASERVLPRASEELRRRALSRARATLHGMDEKQSSWARTSSWFRSARVLAAAAVLTTIALAALALHGRGKPPSVPLGSPSSVGAAKVSAGAPFPPSASQLPETPPTVLPEAEPPAKREAPGKRPRVPAEAEVYALELALLKRARAAVASGDFAVALESTTEHKRRFPAGRLSEEREALRVRALRRLGRVDEARRAAGVFRQSFPRSVLLPRMEEEAEESP